MRQVMEKAQANLRQPGHGPFAALVLRGESVVATGTNRVVATRDPTAHAEMVAIRAASRKLDTHDLSGCTLLTSCEPCPMCLAAAYWARLERIYYCANRTQAAAAGFDDAFIYDQVPLPPGDRSIPAEPLLPTLASAPFAAWRALSDKEPY